MIVLVVGFKPISSHELVGKKILLTIQ